MFGNFAVELYILAMLASGFAGGMTWDRSVLLRLHVRLEDAGRQFNHLASVDEVPFQITESVVQR